MRRFFLFLIHIIIFFTFLSYSQTREERVNYARIQINAILDSYPDAPYEVGEVVDVDSSIGSPQVSKGRISNPYGTLNQCYLFIAKALGAGRKHQIGIYKNEQVIWISDLLSGSEDYGDMDEGFLATKDFNQMGYVDIAVFFSDRTSPPSEYYLWIFKWNGTQGECINHQETDGSTSIVSSRIFEVYDVDGNGRDEILSYTSDIKVSVVYSWDSGLYGEWPSSPDLSGRSYTIADNLTAVVHTYVQKKEDELKYSYQVTNEMSSNQKIKSFNIRIAIDNIDNVEVPISWKGGKWAGYPLVNCFTKDENQQIDKGQNLDSFSYCCSGIPSISTFYVQGPCFLLDNSTMDVDTLVQMAFNNVLDNSFTGLTISPANPPDPFIPLDFLDTLSSYTTRSRTLGWINDQPTADKYLVYFDTAKARLERNEGASAHMALQQVLQDVDIDSTSLLTSEAYALLRYNTEYLIENMDDQYTLIVPTQYATVQAAINAAVAGNNIRVEAGTYEESISIDGKSLITIYSTSDATIRGVHVSNSSAIAIKGFTVNASTTSADAIVIDGTNANITIDANDIINSTKNGIAIAQSNSNVRVFNNVIAENQQCGIYFTDGTTGTQYIVNNTIVKNGTSAIEAASQQELYIVNNIIVYDPVSGKSGGRYAVRQGSGSAIIKMYKNLVVTSISGVLETDYRPLINSTIKDKGITNFSPLPDKDKDGNPRVAGTAIDLGAYELQ